MPLNRETGERIPHAPHLNPRPVPASKYRDLPNARVPYEYMPEAKEGKFVTPQIISRPMYEDAVERAKAAFVKAGSFLPIWFNEDAILVQEFPEVGQVEFVFVRQVAGQEMCVRIPYTLPPDFIGWLKATKRWS
jgi:hypothetical protein